MELPENAPAPRLCHIIKWAHFDGYGFNLHADKSRAGQYIGKVDTDSPAEASGLREYDRIIEVNGVNISNENHTQAVQRIKSIDNETKLLVVDTESDRWYKEHDLVVRSDQANVIHGSSEKPESPEADTKSVTSSESASEPQPAEVDPISDEVLRTNEHNLQAPPLSSESDSDSVDGPDAAVEERNGDLPSSEDVKVSRSPSVSSEASSEATPPTASPADSVPLPKEDEEEDEQKTPMSITPSPPPSLPTEKIENETENGNVTKLEYIESTIKPTPEPVKPPSKFDKSGLNLNMSVAEMKALLASKKKIDPRKDTIDLMKKHQIIQNM